MENTKELIRYDIVRHVSVYISEIRLTDEHMHGSFELSYVLGGEAQYFH